MSWGKLAVGRLAQVKVLTADTWIKAGGTTGTCLLSGARMWDHAAVILNVDNVISGTWKVAVFGKILGITRLPLAQMVGITSGCFALTDTGTSNPLLGTSAILLPSANNSPSMLVPDEVMFDNTAAGGISASVIVVAKTNRGQLPKGTLNRSRVQEGVLMGIVVPITGAYVGSDTIGVTGGITQSQSITLQNTAYTGTTNFGLLGGLGQLQMWDTAHYWMDCSGTSGSWNVLIQGAAPGGHTVTIAGISQINGATKVAFYNNGAWSGLRPNSVYFQHRGTGGVSMYIAGTIVYACKATRGQKRGFGR